MTKTKLKVSKHAYYYHRGLICMKFGQKADHSECRQHAFACQPFPCRKHSLRVNTGEKYRISWCRLSLG